MKIDQNTELVIAADIARRIGVTPQRVHALVDSPGFPKPLGRLGRSNVWRWNTIERWAKQTGRLTT